MKTIKKVYDKECIARGRVVFENLDSEDIEYVLRLGSASIQRGYNLGLIAGGLVLLGGGLLGTYIDAKNGRKAMIDILK